MLRKVDQNEENKGLEESAQKIPRKRHESESLENVLSEVNFLKFDNEEDYESLNREPMSALN